MMRTWTSEPKDKDDEDVDTVPSLFCPTQNHVPRLLQHASDPEDKDDEDVDTVRFCPAQNHVPRLLNYAPFFSASDP